MEIQRIQEKDLDELIIVGEIDASSSIELDEAIAKSMADGYKKIIVNCSALEYISSAGLGVFMSYIEDFKSKKIAMVITGLNERIANNFDVLGLSNLLYIRNSKEEAKQLINELSV